MERPPSPHPNKLRTILEEHTNHNEYEEPPYLINQQVSMKKIFLEIKEIRKSVKEIKDKLDNK